MPLCDNNIAIYSWSIYYCLCGDERRWVYSQVPPMIHLQFSSAIDPTRPTSGLYGMQFPGTQVLGNRVCCHVCRVRYETFLVPHLEGDTNSDYPTDLLTFSVIAYVVVRTNVNKVPVSRLFKTVVQDATYYFLVIFTSHLMLMMFLVWFTSVRLSSWFSIVSLRPSQPYLQLLPARWVIPGRISFIRSPAFSPCNSGNIVYVWISPCFRNHRARAASS